MIDRQLDRIVWKYGSDSVADKRGVNQKRLDYYAYQWRKHAGKLMIVSSGSVKTGRAKAPHIKNDQVAAGLGTAGLVTAWGKAFARFDILVSQVPVTDHEIEDPDEGATFRQALLDDLEEDIIPNINTNDKLSLKELEKRRWHGENDGLAAHIGILVSADVLGLATEEDGLLDFNGRVVRQVAYDEAAHQEALAYAGEVNERGQGMPMKVQAAIESANNGIPAIICRAGVDLRQVFAGEAGTHFGAKPQDM